MRNLVLGGLLSASVALCAVAGAQGQEVQRSGNVYHRAVCHFVVGDAARCHAQIVTDRAGKAIAGEHQPIGGLFPADLRDAYKVTVSGSSETIVAIVDAFGYDSAEADLATYRSQFGLPPCTTDNGCFKKLNQKGEEGNYPAMNVGWAQESALDMDMVSAMCPNCKIYLVEADTNATKNLGKAVDTAAKLGAHVISNSYGGHEKNSAKFESHFDHPGVAVTASTGDDGYGVQFPASSPHVTAVGGTTLKKDTSDRGWSETVWAGAGSGCSKVYAKPDWQTDKGCHNRTVGDVSADANPATGVAVFGPITLTHSSWLVFGGTSVAAPLVGGVYGANGGTVNYGSNPYAHTDALFDVTSGSNGDCGTGRKMYLCNGEVGYDGPTGLGTPNGTTAFGEP